MERMKGEDEAIRRGPRSPCSSSQDQCAPFKRNDLQPPAVGQTAFARQGVRGFPPLCQKKGTRMGHHLRWGRRRLRAKGFVASYPCARKKAQGWGTTCGGADGACAPGGSWLPTLVSEKRHKDGAPPAVGQTALARQGVRGFLPLCQKKGTRMGHHLRWGRRRLRARGFVASHPCARKKAQGWGTRLGAPVSTPATKTCRWGPRPVGRVDLSAVLSGYTNSGSVIVGASAD